MRLSVRKTDPGYSAKAFRATVYVDGAKVDHCFTADEELGVAYCYESDENGKILIDRISRTIPEIEVRGDVRIEIAEK